MVLLVAGPAGRRRHSFWAFISAAGFLTHGRRCRALHEIMQRHVVDRIPSLTSQESTSARATVPSSTAPVRTAIRLSPWSSPQPGCTAWI